MAGEAQDSLWPIPKFYFQVKLGETEVSFQEVFGVEDLILQLILVELLN